ncbi:MAG: hypothetical protein HYY50_05120 [Candidatus Kerfeldbacteria bacterium]|nr:hypothetical protein [Candidatus Kerfeldbacteria bacterium]
MAHVSSKLSEQGVEPDRLSEELDRVDPDKFMPDWFLEKKYEFLAGSERSAHALGLSALRALEKDGFKVLAGFRNRQEIQALVSHHLTTYEWGRFLELWPHRRQVLKPIFLRHRKYLSSLFGTTPAA